MSLTDYRWWFDSPLVRVRLKTVDPQKGNGLGQTKTCFFSSGMADDALGLGPYMRISCYQEDFNMDTGGRMRVGKS